MAIDLDPKYAGAYHERGLAYSTIGNFELAIDDLSTAIELDPNNFAVYHDRGRTYYLFDNIELAINDLSTAIELEPDEPRLYAMRGTIYQYVAEFERAIEDFTQALIVDATYAEAYRMRGDVYLATLEYELALLDYEKYLELAPDSPERESVLAAMEEIFTRSEELIEIITGEEDVEEASRVTTTSTFVSPDFPWSIDYPSDWIVNAGEPNFVRISRNVDDGLFALCGVHSNTLGFKTLDEFVDFVIDFEDDYFKERGQTYDILSRQAITLTSGMSGIELMVELGPGGKSRRLYFLAAGYEFVIDCETRLSDWPRLEATYDQIINSFTVEDAR